MNIELDGQAGQVRVSDARLFHPERRAYARRLLGALCDHPGVRKAEVDLASSTCRVDFDLASNTPAVMAEVFVEAVRTASARTARTPWWRRNPGWSTLTGYRSRGEISIWETYADRPGRVQLLHRGPEGDRAACSRLADSVASLEGVERCHVSSRARRITVVCDPDGSPLANGTLDRVERILEERKAADPRKADLTSGVALPATDGPAPLATGWNRWRYVALAGGAFTMTLVGLVVPGVPTVPFLLATSYYLARSSPRMNERLLRSAFFGPILQEWEGHAALSLTSKGKLIGLTFTIIVVMVVLTPMSPVALGVILLISSISVYGVTRMPTLAQGEQTKLSAKSGARLPLPA